MRLAALHGFFLVSGGLGLAYEVLWMRQFAGLFGSSVLAASAALSAFFLGSTVGALTFGSRSARWRRPVTAFGPLEIGVGLTALAVRPILYQYQVLYPRFYQLLAPWPASFALAKLLLAVIAVGLPTFFMGGTLPVLGEAVAPSGRRLGVPVGGLYAVNVLGAALGALAVPFVLLPALGVTNAYRLTIAGSLTIGLLAAVLGASWPRPGGDTPAHPRPPGPNAEPVSQPLVLSLAAWSGLATLGLEVLWTRMFSLVHENSVYSFAVVVVVFLTGLSLGSVLARAALRRGLAPRRLLGWAWSVSGALIVASSSVFYASTRGLQFLPSSSWSASLGRLLVLSSAALLLPCIGLGMALPLLMEMAGRDRSPGPVLGRLLSVNTGGAIVGPLLVTFLVSPSLGLWKTIALFGVLTLLAGSVVGLGGIARGIAWVAGAAAIALQPAALTPVRVRVAQGERLVSVREGSYGTTAVVEDAHDRWITVNNSYVLGGAAAAGEERWQGHLPLLLHPNPRRVAFVGVGTGITAGAVLLHPVKQVVALEIVPEVVTAAREDFADLNAHLLTDPRVAVVTDDGRNYLSAAAPGGFDVITGDLLVPWRPGESGLYTREHFEAVRRALAPDGVFCQWLPLYQLSEPQVATLVATFLDVFPATTVWRGNFLPDEPVLGLVGHRSAVPLDVDALDRRAATLAPSIDGATPLLRHPAGVWLSLVGCPRADAAWLSRAPRNTDDEPWVELSSPRERTPLTGAALESLLDTIARSPLEGTPLASLDSSHRAWRDAGMALAHASLDRGPAGEERTLAILRTLPKELQAALGVPATSSTSF